MSKLLTEKEIKRQIKIEILKEVVYQSIEKQIRESFATWLAGKIPGSSEEQMQQALSLVSREEILKNLDPEEFIRLISQDLIPRIKDELSGEIADVIGQSMEKVANNLEQAV